MSYCGLVRCVTSVDHFKWGWTKKTTPLPPQKLLLLLLLLLHSDVNSRAHRWNWDGLGEGRSGLDGLNKTVRPVPQNRRPSPTIWITGCLVVDSPAH